MGMWWQGNSAVDSAHPSASASVMLELDQVDLFDSDFILQVLQVVLQHYYCIVVI